MTISLPRVAGLFLCGALMVGLMAAGVAGLRAMSRKEIATTDTGAGGTRTNVKPVKPQPPPEVQVDIPEGLVPGDAIHLETTVRDDNNTPVKGGNLKFTWFSPTGPIDGVSRDVTITHHGLYYLNFRVPLDGRVEIRVLDGKGAASVPFRVADHAVPNPGRGAIPLAHHFDVAPR